MSKKGSSVFRLTQYALLIALLILAAYFPVKIFVEVTLCFLPVLFGAVLLGPGAGAFLGLIWGLFSYAQCFGWFVPSPFGAAMVAIDPVLWGVVCLVPRVLTGFLVGWLYRGLKKLGAKEWIACGLAGLTAALLNTVLFLGGMMLLFGRSDYILQWRGVQTVWAFLVTVFGINCLTESSIGLVVGMAFANIVPALRRRA